MSSILKIILLQLSYSLTEGFCYGSENMTAFKTTLT